MLRIVTFTVCVTSYASGTLGQINRKKHPKVVSLQQDTETMCDNRSSTNMLNKLFFLMQPTKSNNIEPLFNSRFDDDGDVCLIIFMTTDHKHIYQLRMY